MSVISMNVKENIKTLWSYIKDMAEDEETVDFLNY